MAARATSIDGAARSVLCEGFGDLRAGAVAGAQEEQSRSRSPPRRVASVARRQREPRMERETGFGEKFSGAEQVGPVVDVPPVRRASAGTHDTGLAKLGQVIGDEVLRLLQELHELTDPAIALPELDD